jgi:hypothetical protein
MRKKQRSIKSLTKASSNAVGVVRNMLSSLQHINEAAIAEKVANDNRILKIQSDNQALDKLKEDNEKIISKFEALLS